MKKITWGQVMEILDQLESQSSIITLFTKPNWSYHETYDDSSGKACVKELADLLNKEFGDGARQC